MIKYLVIFSGEANITKIKDCNNKYLFDSFEEARDVMIKDLFEELSNRYPDEESMGKAKENNWNEHFDNCWMETSNGSEYAWQIITIEV